MKHSILSVIFLVLVFLSCKKEDSEPEIKEYNCTLQVKTNTSTVPYTYQFVITNSDGDMLYNEIIQDGIGTPVTYNSSSEKINLSIFRRNENKILVTTYLDIVPGDWELTASNTFYNLAENLYEHVTLVPSTACYTDLPSGIGFDIDFFASGGYAGTSWSLDDSLCINYRHRPSSYYVYILLRNLGLYKINKVTEDTVISLESMQTASELNMSTNLGSAVTPYYAGIQCIMDVNDIYSWFWTNGFNIEPEDQVYPGSGIAYYLSSLDWKDENNSLYRNYYFKNIVPDYHVLIDEPALLNIDFTNFAIKFSGENPTYYSAIWKNENITWSIILPAEETNFNAKKIWNSIQTDFLENIDASSLLLSKVIVETADNLSFQDFYNKVLDSNPTEYYLIEESKKISITSF